MKSDRDHPWTEIVTMPDRPPVRKTVNMEVMTLARKLASVADDLPHDTDSRVLVDLFYDDLMKAEHLFRKLNNESYRE